MIKNIGQRVSDEFQKQQTCSAKLRKSETVSRKINIRGVL